MASKKPMSAKTKALLLDTDVMSTRALTMARKARRCRTCRAWTWAGLADIGPYAGVHVTWAPTTSFGEYLALSAGIATYMLDGAGIERRVARTITKYPADEYRTHTLHMCNGPPLPVHPDWKHMPPGHEMQFPDNPPF